MADNFTANAGSGGDTFAADDIGGVKFPRSKIVIGADGSNGGDVSAANPMPVTGTLVTTGTLAATQSGTWTVQPGNTANSTAWLVTGAGGTFPVTGTVTATGTLAATQSGTWNVTNAGTFAVQNRPETSGGLSIHRTIDLDETEEEVKATAGQLYGMWITNTGTATVYVKFYNDTAANVVVGTTTPALTIPIPGNSSDDVGGVFAVGGLGIPFSTAICAAATTGLADADTGAPAANQVIANIFYK